MIAMDANKWNNAIKFVNSKRNKMFAVILNGFSVCIICLWNSQMVIVECTLLMDIHILQINKNSL